MCDTHPPTRSEALRRLAEFLPKAGRNYALRRNYDLPGHPHVSVLSPYIRHRLLAEDEVIAAVLARHAPSAAEKFVQEVFWRTYWKGWLETRPGVWTRYRADLDRALDRVATESGLRQRWDAACHGETGIDAFDHWARALALTGYLHNHARMWFASIWIFTLELPWELGADFFLRHLLDGDPASNTLSWRWVAGLQTRGKHYTARPSNIAKYTGGRFNPGHQLNTATAPLDGPPHPDCSPLPVSARPPSGARLGLVVTDEDLSLGPVLSGQAAVRPAATIFVQTTHGRSPLAVAPQVEAFVQGAFEDVHARYRDALGNVGPVVAGPEAPARIIEWADAAGLDGLVMAYAPVGPARDLMGTLIRERGVAEIVRPYDMAAWPHATAGFFRFKDRIPKMISSLGLAPAA